MNAVVRTDRDADVLIVTVDHPPVNALSPGVPEGIAAAVEQAQADDAIRAIVVIGAGRTFVAGADIRELSRIATGESGPITLNRDFNQIEQSAKPVVMALHGTPLGGGLELAMAGHYRIAAPATQMGQPEVKLGLIPGAGGTQRLPRLCGIEKALELCVFGESIGAAEALRLGIIDVIAEGELLPAAVAFARRVSGPRRTCDRTAAPAEDAVVERIRKDALKRFRGQTAPRAAIHAVTGAAHLSFADGLEHERRIFEECLHGPQAAALIHAFLGEREVARIPFLPKGLDPIPVSAAAVLGAGTMGRGIAMCFANAGIPVRLSDQSESQVDHAREAIRGIYASSVKKGRMSEAELVRRIGRITFQTDTDGFDSADVLVEAVFENLDLKRRVFTELDRVAKPGAILASNTSSVDIDALAAATSRPEWVIGLHFFSPAHHMRLLEVVRGAKTSPRLIQAAMELGKRLKKVAVLSGNTPGFIGNRMFMPYREAAIRCVEEGATPAQVDQALVDWGMAMGPLAVGDLSGIDIFYHIRREAKLGSSFEDCLYQKGRYGQKTRAGWYLYPDGRTPQPDPVVETLAREYAAQNCVPQRTFSSDEIVGRCLGALRAEGQRILDEGIALRPVDIDMVYVHGYGFPAWRGGPMFPPTTASNASA